MEFMYIGSTIFPSPIFFYLLSFKNYFRKIRHLIGRAYSWVKFYNILFFDLIGQWVITEHSRKFKRLSFGNFSLYTITRVEASLQTSSWCLKPCKLIFYVLKSDMNFQIGFNVHVHLEKQKNKNKKSLSNISIHWPNRVIFSIFNSQTNVDKNNTLQLKTHLVPFNTSTNNFFELCKETRNYQKQNYF